MNKQVIIYAIIAVAVVAALFLFAAAKPEGVSKITISSHLNEIIITKELVTKNYGDGVKEFPITAETFGEIERLVLSDAFKNLNERYPANLPKGFGCTQANLVFTVSYTSGRSKTVIVEGCARPEPEIITEIWKKLPH